MQKDPVCGIFVDTQKAPASTSYQGKTFYFCSLDCKKKFDQNPQQFAKQTA